jgi:hypothetical protein
MKVILIFLILVFAFSCGVKKPPLPPLEKTNNA